MRSWKFLLPLLASSLCFAAQPDRITGPIDSSQMVPLKGNVHGLAQSRFDLGRTDGNQMVSGVTLVFHPSATQQNDLNKLLAQQQERSSPNYHKWLTPAQFADRFGMSKGDISQAVSWLESQGFTVTSVANSRNLISFDGTVAQIELVFATEIHNYLVDDVIHFANATNPSVPAALAASVLSIGHLHNFSPKPRAIVRKINSAGVDSHFTSHISGEHFLTPGDFATIYHLGPLYSAGMDGAGHNIAIIGQSTVRATDLSNFRSAAGLAAKVPEYILYPSTSTATRCSGDEGESDLDLEWSGGVANSANIIFVYAGLGPGDTCSSRSNDVWNALQYAVDQNLAPVISTSYGYCESGLGESFVDTVQGWAQQANTQGQTIMAASGDDGAADCDGAVTSATHGPAVDVPAAIPEVTGMGGTEFFGDPASTSATTYWNATGSSDDISSALSYISEEAWNDTAFNLTQSGGTIAASGGGASIYFGKPKWQTGTGVPADSKRDVPDLALSTSPDHDGYLFCSEDGPNNTIVATCTSGFRDASSDLAVVGGTSAAAPTFSAILTLIEQYLSASGLANINPNLYSLAASNASVFHDATTGNNIVPCTSGTTGCPSSAPFQYGFTAGTGYDQVTGLGSVDADALALAWKASLDPDFQLSAGALNPSSIPAGSSTTATLTISAIAGSTGMVVNFGASSCSGLPAGASCSFNQNSVTFDGTDPVTTLVTISTLANMTLPATAQTVTITPINSPNTTATVSLTVTPTNQSFSIASNAKTYSVVPGGKAEVELTVTGANGFSPAVLPVTYTCAQSSLPTEVQCSFSPTNGDAVAATTLTLDIVTTGPTSRVQPPLGHGSRLYYALLLPGLFGIMFASGSRGRGARLLGLIVVLGLSTLSVSSCGGSSGGVQKNAGTPAGTYAIVVNATTAGPNALTASVTVNLTVQ
ncbi:MAG: S53 family peptidase [Candidatus Sulfotelmatobacter sp.]